MKRYEIVYIKEGKIKWNVEGKEIKKFFSKVGMVLALL